MERRKAQKSFDAFLRGENQDWVQVKPVSLEITCEEGGPVTMTASMIRAGEGCAVPTAPAETDNLGAMLRGILGTGTPAYEHVYIRPTTDSGTSPATPSPESSS